MAFRAGGSAPWRMGLFVVLIYLVRPDAAMIPSSRSRACRGRTGRAPCAPSSSAWPAWARASSSSSSTYGTALPLSFYIKSYLATAHSPEHVAIFFHEKIKNALQFLVLFAPFLFIALVGRNRVALALLAAAAAFCAYHVFFTIETMGHYSRFYMPAVVPILAAAVLSWEALSQARARLVAASPRWSSGRAATPS